MIDPLRTEPSIDQGFAAAKHMPVNAVAVRVALR